MNEKTTCLRYLISSHIMNLLQRNVDCRFPRRLLLMQCCSGIWNGRWSIPVLVVYDYDTNCYPSTRLPGVTDTTFAFACYIISLA